MAIKGHFDGKVIVPDEPVNLPAGQRLIVRLQPEATAATPGPPQGVSGASLLRFAGAIDPQDLDAMRAAIDEGCERVDGNDW